MAEAYNIPRPEAGEWISLSLINRPKSVGLWWALIDNEGWIEGGHISTHRSREAAQAKSRVVADWLKARG